ncbi:MAG: YitT family protein [Lachnospiraceae bacterium]|nr:YitT family protein [Lachnospiraceae bacterium]
MDIRDQVDKTKRQEEKEESLLNPEGLMSPGIRHEGVRILFIIAGSLIYSFGINVFLEPLHLYAGGFVGFSQLFANLLGRTGILPAHIHFAGIIYYLLNIPGMIYAIRRMRRRFVFKTILSVTFMTVFLSLIPIPSVPVLDDRLANCIVAGLLAGTGIGLILRMGASDGGTDTIGMILLQTGGKLSVGRTTLLVNAVLYTICLFLFDIPTVIYSLIYSVFSSMAADRIHTQNISSHILIITKLPDTTPLEIEIMGRLNRGITKWKATGAYTGDDETILMVLTSKYEVNRLRNIVHRQDPHAFIVADEGVNVDGHFLRKLQ